MKIIVLSISILISSICAAQEEDQIWLFGGSSVSGIDIDGYAYGNTSIDFSHSPPIVYYNDQVTLDFDITNTSICTNSGDILMYSNGMQVHNADHQVIPGLDTLGYGATWQLWVVEDFPNPGDTWYTGLKVNQNTIIIPIDESSRRYMLIYQVRDVDDIADTKLEYSIIEYDSVNEIFDIVQKDIVVLEDRLKIGQVNVCRHANGRDWWLIQHNDENTERYVFLIHSKGIEHVHTIPVLEANPEGYSFSQTYYSPHGDMYAISEVHDNGTNASVQLYAFDRCTGETHFIMSDSLVVYRINATLAFSPSGQYMYVSNHQFMYQYDVWAADIKASRTLIAEFDGYRFQYNDFDPGVPTEFGLMAHGPDGKVYSVAGGSNRFVHTIEYPDEKGEEATLAQRSIILSTSNHVGIPNFPHFRLGPLDGSDCDTLGLDNHLVAQYRYKQDSMNYLNIRFTDNSYYRPESWLWDFGDGTTYDGKRPYYHSYATDGEYEVCLTVSNENSTDTHCKTLTIGTTKTYNISDIAKISIYPNPVEDYATMQLHDYIPQEAYIELYDISGNMVRKDRIYHGWNPLNLTTLGRGAYVYRLKDQSVLLDTGKVVKL